MGKTALIDLGTNAVRLMIVEWEADGSCSSLLQEKRPVSLGEDSFAARLLTETAIERTIDALESMVKTARSRRVDEIKAVATSAVRDAENRDSFLERVEKKTGLRLKVISGLEEARLIYEGAARNLNLGEEPGLLIDIGGGSVELIIGSSRGYYELDSLPLGAARLAERFNLAANGGRVDGQTYREMKEYAVNRSRRFAEKARTYEPAFGYGSSGTIENLVRVNARRRGDRSDDRGHPPLSGADLKELAEWMGPLTAQERKSIDGLEARKANIIMAGCATLEALMASLGLNAINAADYGLKHGLIADLLRDRLGAPSGAPDLRETSIRRLGRRCRYDESHAETVSALALTIYDLFAERGLVEPRPQERELLRLAALVHDIGKFLDYQNHHGHSYYLIRHSSLLGFDDDEIELMAFLALSHRKKKKRDWPPYENAPRHDHHNRRKLGFILRLAEILDSRRQGALKALNLDLERNRALFMFREGPGLNFAFEIEALKKNAKAFQNLFGLPLETGLRSQ